MKKGDRSDFVARVSVAKHLLARPNPYSSPGSMGRYVAISVGPKDRDLYEETPHSQAFLDVPKETP